MARCDMCGNEYDKAFRIEGPRGNGTFYCCAHCAKESGVVGIDDRI